MKRRKATLLSSMFVLCLIISLAPVFSNGQQEDGRKSFDSAEEWEQYAGLGQYRPKEDDWEEIERKAKEEGHLVVYCNSGSIFDSVRTFSEEYGIKVEPYDLATGSLYEKLGREQKAGVYNCDVVLSSGTHTLNNEFVKRGTAYRFVPRYIEPKLLEDIEDQPLGIQRLGGKAVAYNSEVYDKPPVDSWWDLTRPEWENRLTMKDPMQGGSEIGMMMMFVRNSDLMAELYMKEFGEPIELSEGVENAGYEFVKRLIENGIVLTSSGTPAAIAAGTKGQEKPPLAIVSPSKMKYRETNNLAFEIAWNLDPVGSYVSYQALAVPIYAPNPHAAKLYIRWAYEEGFEPWNQTGTWPARKDLPLPPDQPALSDVKTWYEDPDYIYEHIVEFQDFWIQHQSN
ncbi:MAG: ABC transporter substrate-binding protein [Spirochaetaceae bacterium]|nr:ABC transporter substrate-binding protein [Spirochaetaceae bacterium]MCF7947322.1 ABC transporter substrate-binding protein [Spirochaetia bacterium]MCF7950548.1 ABC transporter substrate-binding protein [Spirochaetaceae bacterium]